MRFFEGFFFFFSWAADASDLSRSQLWNMKLDFLDEQDKDTWRQSTELKKSVVQSVSLCLSYLFLYILTSKFIQKLKKKIKQAKKKIKPWILLNQTRAEKQMRAAALRHRIYFFLALQFLVYFEYSPFDWWIFIISGYFYDKNYQNEANVAEHCSF